MKRRQFIQKSALTAVTLAMPWSKIIAQAPKLCSTNFQEYKWLNEKKESYKINIDLCKEAVLRFENAEAEHKIIKLGINQNLKDEQGKINIKEYRADLKIKSVKKDKNIATDYKIETEFLQENKNEFELPKELNVKKLSLVYHEKIDMSAIDVLDKKGSNYLTIIEKAPLSPASDDDGDEDCFLTTACVSILGKADNCAELTVLRKFRDEVLKTSATGKKLIKEYYNIAPGIVKAIAVRSDKKMIYTKIYEQMILPTIKCIESDDQRGAISIYKNYTLTLKELYL